MDTLKNEFKVQFTTEGFGLTRDQQSKMVICLQTLQRSLNGFPVAELRVDIEQHARTGDYHVRTNLRLPKRTLSTGERNSLVHYAYERCIKKLLHKIDAYKQQLQPRERRVKEPAANRIGASVTPDVSALDQAVSENDYTAFRDAMHVYDETLSRRVGRWIQRYPQLESRLGRDLIISDILEEIYLNAFEHFAQRPTHALSEWLESLIDVSLRTLIHNPAELEDINYVASAQPE